MYSETTYFVSEHIPYGAIENNCEKGDIEVIKSTVLKSCIKVLFMD